MAIIIRIALITLLLSLSCRKSDYNPKLVDYLKAERELRKRIPANQGLADSLVALQKNYRMDVEKELRKLHDKPESWIKLLRAIDGEK